MAIQLLSVLAPARVVAVDRAQDKLELAREIGAVETVLSDGGDDVAAQVREATRGRGAELVLDLVGSDETLALGAQVARPESDLVLVGIAGGTFPLSFFSQPYECAVATTYWGTALELMEVLELARSGRIHAHVERFSLDDVGRVYERLRRGEIEGRAVVCPAG
jgi:propanol-preferring alcohol dehydrogenase